MLDSVQDLRRNLESWAKVIYTSQAIVWIYIYFIAASTQKQETHDRTQSILTKVNCIFYGSQKARIVQTLLRDESISGLQTDCHKHRPTL